MTLTWAVLNLGVELLVALHTGHEVVSIHLYGLSRWLYDPFSHHTDAAQPQASQFVRPSITVARQGIPLNRTTKKQQANGCAPNTGSTTTPRRARTP